MSMTNFSPCVTKNHSLSDCESIVQVAKSVELPVFLFHSYKELFNSFQGQFITFHEDSNGVRHEFRRHFQNIVRQRSTQKYHLRSRRKKAVNFIDLVFEALVEKFISFVEHQHFDVSCSQTSPSNHVENTTRSPWHDMLAVFEFLDVLSYGCTPDTCVTLYVHIVTQSENDRLNLSCQFSGGW